MAKRNDGTGIGGILLLVGLCYGFYHCGKKANTPQLDKVETIDPPKKEIIPPSKTIQI